MVELAAHPSLVQSTIRRVGSSVPPTIVIASSPSGGLLARWTSAPPVRYSAILGFDAFFTGSALYLALALRFEGSIPAEQLATFSFALPMLLLIRLALTIAIGLHRWSFRMSGLSEAVRLAGATLAVGR